jgi:hypothetical protein
LLDKIELNGTLIDISLCGALFAADLALDLPPGTECGVAIYRHRRPSSATMRGSIVYCADRCFGIQFIEIGDAAEQELRLMIDMNLASPRLLERDLAALLR